jgi:hypothetical protein
LRSGYNTSKLYGNAPKDILDILESQNVTSNFHHFCVTEAVSDVIYLDKQDNGNTATETPGRPTHAHALQVARAEVTYKHEVWIC